MKLFEIAFLWNHFQLMHVNFDTYTSEFSLLIYSSDHLAVAVQCCLVEVWFAELEYTHQVKKAVSAKLGIENTFL